jgi:hypothetical protein
MEAVSKPSSLSPEWIENAGVGSVAATSDSKSSSATVSRNVRLTEKWIDTSVITVCVVVVVFNGIIAAMLERRRVWFFYTELHS